MFFYTQYHYLLLLWAIMYCSWKNTWSIFWLIMSLNWVVISFLFSAPFANEEYIWAFIYLFIYLAMIPAQTLTVPLASSQLCVLWRRVLLRIYEVVAYTVFLFSLTCYKSTQFWIDAGLMLASVAPRYGGNLPCMLWRKLVMILRSVDKHRQLAPARLGWI